MAGRTGLAVCVAALTAAGAALAQVPPDARVKFADPRTEDRSGETGVAKRLEAKSAYQYLLEIEAFEHKDKPCQVRARFAHVNQFNQFEQVWTDPGCKSPGAMQKAGVRRELGREFIRSLSVCLHDGLTGGNRVKGVRGRTVSVERSPLLTRSDRLVDGHVNLPTFNDESLGFERPNCSERWQDWQAPSTCGADRVATGVVIEHKAGAWVSLRLICSYMVPNR